MVIRFNGECGILPKCRSPEILRYETEICRDCSADYDGTELLVPGLCGFAKPYDITAVDPISFTDKRRVFQFTSDFFPEVPGVGDLSMTQEIVDNKIQAIVTPSPGSYSLNYIGSNLIELYFSEFKNNMEVIFTLKNATLTETYVDELDSNPLKVLIQN